jgi:periplasmic protein TonB
VRLTFFEEREWTRGPFSNRLHWFIVVSIALHLALLLSSELVPSFKRVNPTERSPIFVRVLDPSELNRLIPRSETRLPSAPNIISKRPSGQSETLAPRAGAHPAREAPVASRPGVSHERGPDAAALPQPPPDPGSSGSEPLARRAPPALDSKGSTGLPFVESGELERLAKVFTYRDNPKQDIVSLNTDDLKYASYMHQLKRRVETILQYPESLRGRNPPVEGRVYVQFTIGKSGVLEDIALVASSGHPELDRESLRAIRESFPFLPLPDSWKQERLMIPARVVFEVGYISVY